MQKVWHKVTAPKSWRAEAGEELVGIYVGSTTRDGQFGPYQVHFIKNRRGKVLFVSGSVSDSLFALVPPDSKVKLVFNGVKKTQVEGHEYKCYDLFTEEAIELRIAN